jgi:hypothetical protein
MSKEQENPLESTIMKRTGSPAATRKDGGAGWMHAEGIEPPEEEGAFGK